MFIIENEEDLQQLFDIVEEESRQKDLEVNSKKVKVIVIGQNNECLRTKIFIKGN